MDSARNIDPEMLEQCDMTRVEGTVQDLLRQAGQHQVAPGQRNCLLNGGDGEAAQHQGLAVQGLRGGDRDTGPGGRVSGLDLSAGAP